MIDFHNHILPGVDDGSKSMEMSLNMLKTAAEQGITKIVNTIHYQHPKMENKNTDFSFIDSIRKEVIHESNKIGIFIDIKIAAEVYYSFDLNVFVDNPLTTINNYMLIEFPCVARQLVLLVSFSYYRKQQFHLILSLHS